MTQAFQPFRFAILADFHLRRRGVPELRRALADAGRRGVDFALLLGDVIWQRPMEELAAMLDTLPVPRHLTIGNHDVGRAAEYERCFGPSRKAFVHKGCAFVGLSNAAAAFGRRDSREGFLDDGQKTWLLETLTSLRRGASLRHVFVYAHVPPLPPGGAADPAFRMPAALSEWFFHVCDAFDVTACFFGHVHHDEVFRRGGTLFVTTPSTVGNVEADGGAKVAAGGYRIVDVSATDVAEEVIWLGPTAGDASS